MGNYAQAYQLAQFANQAYSKPPQIDTAVWKEVIPSQENASSGFFAMAYQNKLTGEVIIAYRGTDGKSDIPADIAISGITSWNNQFTEALRFANDVREAVGDNPAAQISVTGHSLGGSLAQVTSQMFGFAGAAFDPGGAANLIESADFESLRIQFQQPEGGAGAPPSFTNHVVPFSVVSELSGLHIGEVKSAASPLQTLVNAVGFYAAAASGIIGASIYNFKHLHSMDRIEQMMKLAADIEYAEENGWGNLMDLELGISPLTATTFTLAAQALPARRDPLTLDLDGNGLDTTGIDPANPILFDHDADGIKTATGWVQPDDAFLVLDRNGNNTIDTGRELFGDSTPLYASGLAADGFAALAQEDSNADGRVDASDTRFADLRLWQDANQDGISQSGELKTLAQAGIAALIVAKTENAILLPNGNQIADLGGYLRSDGSGGVLGATEQMADIDLASNPFYSEFADSIPLTEAAQILPDMKGAGQVRSLREAASLDTPEGQALAAELAAFAAETTRNGQTNCLDNLLKTWADTSRMATTATGAFAGVNLSLSFAGVGAGTTAYQAWLDKLTILERFNGQTFLPVPEAGTSLSMIFYDTREALLDQSYQSLKDSVYGALALQTRLKPYLDSIALTIDDTGIALDYTAMRARLDAQKANDAKAAVMDLVDLQRYAGANLPGWKRLARIEVWLAEPERGARTGRIGAVGCRKPAANESRWWRGGEFRDNEAKGMAV